MVDGKIVYTGEETVELGFLNDRLFLCAKYFLQQLF
jgi:hypothetical protein